MMIWIYLVIDPMMIVMDSKVKEKIEVLMKIVQEKKNNKNGFNFNKKPKNHSNYPREKPKSHNKPDPYSSNTKNVE